MRAARSQPSPTATGCGVTVVRPTTGAPEAKHVYARGGTTP
jgi:hypothetical protein